MFEIGWSEILLVAVVAVFVIGPREIPGVMRSLGRMAAKANRIMQEFRGALHEMADTAGHDIADKKDEDIKGGDRP